VVCAHVCVNMNADTCMWNVLCENIYNCVHIYVSGRDKAYF
jgi:hypothetical protein